MAIQDCTRFLGKRVRYTFFDDFEGRFVSFTGRVLSMIVYAEGYQPEDGHSEVLFLEDGYDEPDYISTSHIFHLIE